MFLFYYYTGWRNSDESCTGKQRHVCRNGFNRARFYNLSSSTVNVISGGKLLCNACGRPTVLSATRLSPVSITRVDGPS